MHACMKFAKNKTDIVILQESWMRDENITISHSSFICIKSNVQNTHVRVLIFIAKNAKKFTCTSRSDIVNSEDMQAISIANNKIQREILLFNIYNEKSQNTDDEFFFYFFLFFFICSLSACSLWLWHCLGAVCMLSYM